MRENFKAFGELPETRYESKYWSIIEEVFVVLFEEKNTHVHTSC